MKRVLLASSLAVAACGGGAAGQDAKHAGGGAAAEKKDEAGSIAALAASQGGLAALGGAGNREDDGATGAEVAMSGALRAEEVDRQKGPKLDGLLREWPPRTTADARTGKTDGMSLDVGVMYDDARLYVAAEVTDPHGSRSGKHTESEDHVSMTIAFPSGRGTLSAYDVGFWAGKPGSSMGAVRWLSGPSKGQDVAGAKIVESDTKGGYVFEAALPWASFAEARTTRVGLRAALRYQSFDGGPKGTLATGPGGVSDPNALAPLPTAPERAVVEGLLDQRHLATTKPRIDLYADVAGDDRKERISVFGNFFTICGPGYRSGHQFFWRDVAGDVVSLEARDVTGRGKEDLVVRKRFTLPATTREVLEVWSVVPGDEPTTVFAHEVAVVSKDGKRRIATAARISPKEIEVSVEPAVGWDAASWHEPAANDVDPVLLPWGTVKSRTYKWDKTKFARSSEVAQAGSAAPPSQAQAPALARDTSAPRVTQRTDLGKQVLDAYYRDAGIAPGTKPRFDFEIQLDKGAPPERVLLVGRDVVVLGPTIRNGAGYARLSLTQFADENDVSEVTARDLTGDGGAEIIVRGVRHVAPSGGGERVDVQGLFVYRVQGDRLTRIFAVETGREQGKSRVQGLVQFVPAKGGKGFDVDVRPGGARGWTEKSYPWPQDKPGGSIEPLLLPWGKIANLHYAWNGTQYALVP